MEKSLSAQTLDLLENIETRNDAQGKMAFAEVHSNDDGELFVKLNCAAAVELCRSIMELVDADIDGKHQHFDNFNFVDEGDGKFTIIYSKSC